MGKAIEYPRHEVPLPGDSALTVEVGCRLECPQIFKSGAQFFWALEASARIGASTIDKENLSICGEKGQLALDVSAVRTMGVGIEKLANGQSIGDFLRGGDGMDRSGKGRVGPLPVSWLAASALMPPGGGTA